MTLADLSDFYANFYAPTFAIKLGTADLLRDLHVAATQVEVDLVLGAASRFSFTVTDCYDAEHQVFVNDRNQDLIEMLDFGTPLEIHMGYGDGMSVIKMFSGVITEVTTNFPESGSPELAISGYDHGFPLTLGKNMRSWAKRRDSDAAHEIASYNNLPDEIDVTKDEHPQIEQKQESDWEFLKKIADRNHYELYVDEERTLHFAKPQDTSTAVVTLPYGAGLLSFKPEANLAGQIAKVEVYGWDRNRKEQIVGVARAGEESGLTGKSAGQRLATFVRDPSKQPTLRLRQPVFTQAEANERAKAALDERAKQFLTGDAESIGLPDVRPDMNVELTELGKPFSKTYYVQQATHKVDASGYRTRFKVKETGL